MRHPKTDPQSLQKHMVGTYFSLRLGMGLLAAVLPPLLYLIGRFVAGSPLRCSMSAYYHVEAARDVFVGVLIAVGTFLYLYKGFSTKENAALNLAGAFAVGIALVPTGSECGQGMRLLSLHGVFAVVFFLAIAYVSIARASDTLSLIRDPARAKRYRTIYRSLGWLMVLSPLGAVAINFYLGRRGAAGDSVLVFLIEAFAVFTFAAYWLFKSRELSETDAEELALEQALKRKSATPSPEDDPGELIQIAPSNAIGRSSSNDGSVSVSSSAPSAGGTHGTGIGI
jgi:hypothetical protein